MSDLANRLVDVLTELLDRGAPDVDASELGLRDLDDFRTPAARTARPSRWSVPKSPFERAYASRCRVHGRSDAEDG